MRATWIQAVGTFNRADNSGQFVSVQRASESSVSEDQNASSLHISVEDDGGKKLAEIPVSPAFGSCDDVVDVGTFQVFFKLPKDAKIFRLVHEDLEIAIYFTSAQQPTAPGTEALGLGPRTGHSVPLTQAGSPDPDATYTVQAREKGSDLWQTLDIGLDRPDAGQIDLNQFPNAEAIEVRVLKSSGFDLEEIDRAEIGFNE
ncbi:hypothetical protein NBRC116594_10080 [Shimia sp. NS0008-38b]